MCISQASRSARQSFNYYHYYKQAGIECLAKAFPQWPVTGIRVLPGPVLHLKSMSSMAGIDLIAISETTPGKHAWKEIQEKPSINTKH